MANKQDLADQILATFDYEASRREKRKLSSLLGAMAHVGRKDIDQDYMKLVDEFTTTFANSLGIPHTDAADTLQ